LSVIVVNYTKIVVGISRGV